MKSTNRKRQTNNKCLVGSFDYLNSCVGFLAIFYALPYMDSDWPVNECITISDVLISYCSTIQRVSSLEHLMVIFHQLFIIKRTFFFSDAQK